MARSRVACRQCPVGVGTTSCLPTSLLVGVVEKFYLEGQSTELQSSFILIFRQLIKRSFPATNSKQSTLPHFVLVHISVHVDMVKRKERKIQIRGGGGRKTVIQTKKKCNYFLTDYVIQLIKCNYIVNGKFCFVKNAIQMFHLYLHGNQIFGSNLSGESWQSNQYE